jgi:hypothetical protein
LINLWVGISQVMAVGGFITTTAGCDGVRRGCVI